MKFIRSYKLININGKSKFEDLSLKEIAEMIQASMLPEGNKSFANPALDEFLYSNLKRDDLLKIQYEILENIYIDVKDSKVKEINTDFLKKYISDLNSG